MPGGTVLNAAAPTSLEAVLRVQPGSVFVIGRLGPRNRAAGLVADVHDDRAVQDLRPRPERQGKKCRQNQAQVKKLDVAWWSLPVS